MSQTLRYALVFGIGLAAGVFLQGYAHEAQLSKLMGQNAALNKLIWDMHEQHQKVLDKIEPQPGDKAE
jgi:hypothetical protein